MTASEVADAFGITKERARTDLSILRHWLGEDPRTGEPHLPDARAQRDRADRGAVYATHGVLSDLDLPLLEAAAGDLDRRHRAAPSRSSSTARCAALTMLR